VLNLVSNIKGRTQIGDVENGLLRRIFGPKRNDVKGGWRKLHTDEIPNLCSYPSIIRMMKARKMKLAGYVVHITEMKNACKILVEIREGKRLLRRHTEMGG
jgi:hypothetical protein